MAEPATPVAEHPAYVGVDLAWGPNAWTGLAVVDADGRLRAATRVRTDHEIVSWVRAWAPGPCVVAVDAPIVVRNATGLRTCERLVARHFGPYKIACHAANTANPHFAGTTRAQRLAGALGLDVDPDASAPRRALEVYPHTAIVGLFDLPERIPYKAKPGRDLAALTASTTRLLDLVEGLERADVPLHVRDCDDWRRIRTAVASASRKSELARVEDAVDAVVCAHVARHAVAAPDRTRVLGTVDDGYIVTPVTPALAAAIDGDAGPRAIDGDAGPQAIDEDAEPRAESDLRAIRDRMRAFVDERDWGQFHDPKSLVLALTGEVGELAELFQWVPADEACARASTEPLRTRVGEEMADVLAYLVRLSDVCGIDLADAVAHKIDAAEARFPADAHRGRAPHKG